MNVKNFFLIIFLFNSSAFAKDHCEAYQLPANFLKMQSQVNQQIAHFAQKKKIAINADEAMTKLMKVGSPILKNWMNQPRFANSTDDEIVREWRLDYAKNYLLAGYPTGKSDLDREISSLVNRQIHSFLTPKLKKNLEGLFAVVKENSIKKIEQYGFSEKQQVLKKIKEIKIYIPDQLKGMKKNMTILDLLYWGIAYDPQTNEINIGLNVLSYPNDESVMAVFAHEIAHAFDSCRWSASFTGNWPFEKVGNCLRSEQSVVAKKRDDRSLEVLVKQGVIPSDVADNLRKNPTCNKSFYPPQGIQSDQILESFSDWFSAEVVSIIPRINLKNIRKDLCEKQTLSVGSSYPENSDRLRLVYGAHPRLREHLGFEASSKTKYCTFELESESK